MSDMERLCVCGNCEKEWKEGELGEPIDLWERLDPGDEVPAGECPECGALCYLADVARSIAPQLRAEARDS